MDLMVHKPFSKIGGLSFNVSTGQIKFFADWILREEGVAGGDWIKIRSSPRSNCKRCYGRGYIGKHEGRCLPCSCVYRKK